MPDVARIERKTWLVLLAAGVLTATSSLLVFRAVSLGDALRASPLTNITRVFSIALAAIFLKEKLSWQVVLGASLMAGGALLIAFAKPVTKSEDNKKMAAPRAERPFTNHQAS